VIVPLGLLVSRGAFAQQPKDLIRGDESAIMGRLMELKRGRLSKLEKINLADNLIKLKRHEEADKLYEESLDSVINKENSESHFNWATSLIERGDLKNGFKKYNQIEKILPPNSPLRKLIRNNIKRAMNQDFEKNKNNKDQQSQSEKSQKDQSAGQSQGQSENESNSQDNQSAGNSSGDNQSNQKEESNPFDTKNSESSDENADNAELGGKNAKDQVKEDQSKGNGDEPQQDPDTSRKIYGQGSPLLEQLKQDDRKLQLKLLDTSTQNQYDGKKKDW
jgi:Ca-activated chloride channel family protein